MRFDIWEAERAKAELAPNGMRILREDSHAPAVKIWLPKAKNPSHNVSFKTAERREQFIASAIERFDAYSAQKAQEKQDLKTARENADLKLVDPGSVFVYSYGYDQTNVHYYQVVKRSGRTLTLREIACETVPGSTRAHGMAEDVRPAIDQFIAACALCGLSEYADNHHIGATRFEHTYEPGFRDIRKRVTFDTAGNPHLSMDCGSASLVKIVRFANAAPLTMHTHYRSSYY